MVLSTWGDSFVNLVGSLIMLSLFSDRINMPTCLWMDMVYPLGMDMSFLNLGGSLSYLNG